MAPYGRLRDVGVEQMALLDRRVAYDTPTGALPIELPEGLVPTGATLTFSTRIAGGLSGGEDGVERGKGALVPVRVRHARDERD